jgi:hypothetical protein
LSKRLKRDFYSKTCSIKSFYKCILYNVALSVFFNAGHFHHVQ